MATESDSLRRRGTQRAQVIGSKLGLTDPSHLAALRDAYLVTYEFPAPLMVRVADDMLADLRHDIAARRVDRAVALGRDGHHLALAMKQFDAGFYRRHISNLVLSRVLVESALQDLECHQGLTFPKVQGFRTTAHRVDPARTVAAFRTLTDYLHDERVPVGRPGSRVALVDTSFKGSVQELLAAVYPETGFLGRYAFYGESPDDPHPGSKKGYEVHLSAAETNGGRALEVLPADEAKTFGHRIAVHSVEKLLNGPMTSPERMGVHGPEQAGQRHEQDALRGISRGRLSARLEEPAVRECVKVMNLKAVSDLARDCAVLRDAGGNYRVRLDDGAARYRQEIRAWISSRPADQRLAEFLDSFVYRSDNRQVEALQKTLDRARAPERDRQAIWDAYERCGSDGDKRVFVENVGNAMRKGGGGDGRGQQAGGGSRGHMDGARRDGRDF